MQPTQQTACETFRGHIGDLQKQMQEVFGLFNIFATNSGDSALVEQAIGQLQKAHEQFNAAYQEKAKEIVANWIVNSDLFPSKERIITFDGSGRVNVEGWRLILKYETSYVPTLIRRIGTDLLLSENDYITNIDYLEEVGGELRIRDVRENYPSPFVSAKRLRKVGKSIQIKSRLSSFESLEEVGESFLPSGAQFTSAPKLRKVGKHFHISFTGVRDFREAFPQLREVGLETNVESHLTVKNREMANQVRREIDEGRLTFRGRVFSTQA